ncbi:methyltransferase domain-containing protein [Methylibium sp.]|uniref:class I SAM-dependent methyltransferase n=1 Tax=Methylibium sp. TaxID=2067992 RepID=UPI00286A9922|nr:methyltransferase domain-containing protein [Methylibium sp.]
MKPDSPRRTPDRDAALAQYRQRAGLYDVELALFEPIRQRAILELGLRRGATVLDIGCGTGLSFALLQSGVQAQGRIVGIEQCPEMMAQARQRVERMGWRNVTLLCAPVEEANIAVTADAALLHFTHDILRRPEAVDAVIGHLRPRACVVAAGLKWAAPWAWPTNLFVWAAALHSVSSMDGLDAPWTCLAARLENLQVQTMLMETVYIARGELAGH